MNKSTLDCNKIKDLSERLNCFKRKANELLNLLENERIEGAAEESNTNFSSINDELNLLNRLIEKTEKQIKALKNKEIVKSQGKFKDIVRPGSRVVLKNLEKELAVRLMEDSLESEVDEKMVTNDSPVGRAILGKRVGEAVKIFSPSGEVEYLIHAIG